MRPWAACGPGLLSYHAWARRRARALRAFPYAASDAPWPSHEVCGARAGRPAAACSRARGACDMRHTWAPADPPVTLAQANMPRLTMEDEWEANPDIAAEVDKEIDEYKWF